MAQYYKNESDRFSEKLAENVHRHFRNYGLASNNYKRSAEQNLHTYATISKKRQNNTITPRPSRKHNPTKMLKKIY